MRQIAKPLSKLRVQSAVDLTPPSDKFHKSIVSGQDGLYVVCAPREFEGTATFVVGARGSLNLIRYDSNRARGSCLVNTAVKRGNHLVLGGALDWFGNGPRYELQTYERKKSRWKFTSAARSTHECWGGALSKSFLTGESLALISRTYPKYMNASHAAALLAVKENFRLQNGRVVRTGQTLISTAYNTLDSLAGALRANNIPLIADIVPDTANRAKLRQSWAKVGPVPSVSSKNSYNSVDGTVYTWGDWANPEVTISFERSGKRWVVSHVE